MRRRIEITHHAEHNDRCRRGLPTASDWARVTCPACLLTAPPGVPKCCELAENVGDRWLCKYHPAAYVSVNGTSYSPRTPEDVVIALEKCRIARTRVVIEYGNVETGVPWGDTAVGKIGRSCGPIKVPLSLYNSRSTGGPSVLDWCIVRITTSKGGEVLYQHPEYPEKS